MILPIIFAQTVYLRLFLRKLPVESSSKWYVTTQLLAGKRKEGNSRRSAVISITPLSR